jgi:PAS domain S-box-containing protein
MPWKSKASVTKIMGKLGAIAACAFAIAIPGMYCYISITEIKQTHTIEAASLARSIAQIIQSRPDLWEYESIRLKELLSQPSIHGEEDEREIRTVAGKLIAKNDFKETLPIISVSAPLFDSGRLAGSIIVRGSIKKQVIITALLGILSSLFGFLTYFLFRTYPLKKLENTLTDLQRERDKSEKTLYAIGDGVISVDHRGKVLFINRVAESLVGMDASEAVGRPLEKVYALHQDQENQVGKEGLILVSKRGSEYAIEEVRTLLEAEADKSGVVIVFRDITDRKLAEEKLEDERRRLRQALDEVRTLRGIVPICAHCKKIRDDMGYWSQVEQYVSDHTEARFSHGICPACLEKEMEEIKGMSP